MHAVHGTLNGKILLSAILALSVCTAGAQNIPSTNPQILRELSLEDLGNIEITSVSRKPEKISEAAAAVFVITRDDIRRAGVVTLPQALQLAPNLHIAQINSNQYAISARGFNTSTANKLLVLIDGRSVYTPFYSGVFWDVQDTLLEDIDRIEVISGPGGTLWGSNAVNGIINITTRHTKDTQGALLIAGTGNKDRALGGFRYGDRLDDHLTYRIYGKYLEEDSSRLTSGNSALDSAQTARAGFRFDWDQNTDKLTLQGDVYYGKTGLAMTNPDTTTEGANLLNRWQRKLTDTSNLQLQIYVDHTKRDIPTSGSETRDTFDVDFQHQCTFLKNHEIVWGGGFRSSSDSVTNTVGLAFIPSQRTLNIINVFLQDSIKLNKSFDLTLGSKLEHNSYTGLEVQPNVRLSWKISEQNFAWGAISRAVRTPSRIDRDVFTPSTPPFTIAGGPGFQSEILTAYELGWRSQFNNRSSLSVSTFYNKYNHIRSAARLSNSGPLILTNDRHGDIYGIETWGDLNLTNDWRIKAGYAYLSEHLELDAGSIATNETNDPKHRFQFRSSTNLKPNLEFDWALLYVSDLPERTVPGYTTLDMRLGWEVDKSLEIALIGRNLLGSQHPEFGTVAQRLEIERSILVKAVWKF